jgi:hypothetical protein
MQDIPHVQRPSLPVEVAGWYGMVAILLAYALSSFGVIGHGALFQALNLTGALGLSWLCFCRRTWQAFWLEAIWAGVALVSLLRLWV